MFAWHYWQPYFACHFLCLVDTAKGIHLCTCQLTLGPAMGKEMQIVHFWDAPEMSLRADQSTADRLWTETPVVPLCWFPSWVPGDGGEGEGTPCTQCWGSKPGSFWGRDPGITGDFRSVARKTLKDFLRSSSLQQKLSACCRNYGVKPRALWDADAGTDAPSGSFPAKESQIRLIRLCLAWCLLVIKHH